MEKECCQCHETKDMGLWFYKDRYAKCGYRSTCKVCLGDEAVPIDRNPPLQYNKDGDKWCPKCEQYKNPITEFNKKHGQPQSWCKECNRKRARQYYADNREEHIAEIKRRNAKLLKRNQKWLIKYLLRHPCVDCDEANILVLEFDHLRDKKEQLSKLIRRVVSVDRLKEEIAKCEVVCANCHRIRTSVRNNNYKAKYLNNLEM
jgi:hypothetical protein